jgi:putative FmdB family regulatory protein
MALYEYFCEIHQTFEITQKITDEPLEECPMCREENDISTPVKKLISLCAFHLIGGKWADSGYS